MRTRPSAIRAVLRGSHFLCRAFPASPGFPSLQPPSRCPRCSALLACPRHARAESPERLSPPLETAPAGYAFHAPPLCHHRISQPRKSRRRSLLRTHRLSLAQTRRPRRTHRAEESWRSPPRHLVAEQITSLWATPGSRPLRHGLLYRHPRENALPHFRGQSLRSWHFRYESGHRPSALRPRSAPAIKHSPSQTLSLSLDLRRRDRQRLLAKAARSRSPPQ